MFLKNIASRTTHSLRLRMQVCLVFLENHLQISYTVNRTYKMPSSSTPTYFVIRNEVSKPNQSQNVWDNFVHDCFSLETI